MTAGCPPNNSSSYSNSSCKPCNSCKNNCSPYALKCNTYKSTTGTILIPGPQGQPSSSLANFSGINNLPTSGTSQTVYFSNLNYTNIVPSTTTIANDTITFNLSGKYLFQYNVFVSTATSGSSIYFSGKVNGLIGSTFGTQNITISSSYGCSVIQDIQVGDYLSLMFNNTSNTWNFASLTIIKLIALKMN
jgi:hypothetical protein